MPLPRRHAARTQSCDMVGVLSCVLVRSVCHRFVEEVLAYRSRSDARMLLGRARLLCQQLEIAGEEHLPKVRARCTDAERS